MYAEPTIDVRYIESETCHITLVETARNYLGDAERMHQSALNISELYNGFQALTVDPADAERLAFNDRYSAFLKDIPVDHKDIDYKRFMIRAAKDLGIRRSKYAMLVLSYEFLWVREFNLYLSLILVPIVALAAFLLFR